MGRNYLALTLCSLTLFLGSSSSLLANAEADLAQLPALHAILEGAKAQEVQQVALLNQISAEAVNPKKELAVYTVQKPVVAQKLEALNKRAIPLAAEGEKHKAAVDRHELTCAEKVSRDEAYVARCNGEGQQLNAWRQRVLKQNKEIIDAAKPLVDVLKREEALVAQLESLRKRYADSKKAAEDARARAESISARIRAVESLCKQFQARRSGDRTRDLEQMVNCQSQFFDGAAQLGPLNISTPSF